MPKPHQHSCFCCRYQFTDEIGLQFYVINVVRFKENAFPVTWIMDIAHNTAIRAILGFCNTAVHPLSRNEYSTPFLCSILREREVILHASKCVKIRRKDESFSTFPGSAKRGTFPANRTPRSGFGAISVAGDRNWRTERWDWEERKAASTLCV